MSDSRLDVPVDLGRVEIVLPPAVIDAIADRLGQLIPELFASSAAAKPSRFLTIDEAAEYLRCGYDRRGRVKRQRVDDLLSRGELTRVKDGRRTLIERAEVEEYLRRQRKRGV